MWEYDLGEEISAEVCKNIWDIRIKGKLAIVLGYLNNLTGYLILVLWEAFLGDL